MFKIGIKNINKIFILISVLVSSNHLLAQGESNKDGFKLKMIYLPNFDTTERIEFRDGRIVRQQLGMVVHKGGAKGTTTIDNKDIYKTSEIAGYKTGTYYRALILDKKNVITAKLFKTGKINVYVDYDFYAMETVSVKAGNKIYLQKGKGEITKFSLEKLTEMVADNPKSMEYINDYRMNKQNGRYLEMAIDAYNGVILEEDEYLTPE